MGYFIVGFIWFGLGIVSGWVSRHALTEAQKDVRRPLPEAGHGFVSRWN